MQAPFKFLEHKAGLNHLYLAQHQCYLNAVISDYQTLRAITVAGDKEQTSHLGVFTVQKTGLFSPIGLTEKAGPCLGGHEQQQSPFPGALCP